MIRICWEARTFNLWRTWRGGYAVVEGMRLFPMRGKIVPFIVVAIAAPFVPLIFFVYNAQELLFRILTVLL